MQTDGNYVEESKEHAWNQSTVTEKKKASDRLISRLDVHGWGDNQRGGEFASLWPEQQTSIFPRSSWNQGMLAWHINTTTHTINATTFLMLVVSIIYIMHWRFRLLNQWKVRTPAFLKNTQLLVSPEHYLQICSLLSAQYNPSSSNPWPTGHTWPGTALNGVQH